MITPQNYLIILAEDNEELRGAFERLLKEKGFEVETYDNGQSLLERLLSFEGDLEKLVIVSDTDMPIARDGPRLDGDEACRQALETKPKYKKTIIIGMSDTTANEEYWEGIEVWNCFIHKHTKIEYPECQTNLAELVYSRVNNIVNNPGDHYKLPDGTLRRRVC